MIKKDSTIAEQIKQYKFSKADWIKQLWMLCEIKSQEFKSGIKKRNNIPWDNDVITLNLFHLVYRHLFIIDADNNPYFKIIPSLTQTNSKTKPIEKREVILYDDELSFLIDELLHMTLFLLNDFLDWDSKFYHRKYPKELFETANTIYKSKQTQEKTFRYADALFEAMKQYSEFRHIGVNSVEFYNADTTYRKYRSKKK